MNIIGHGIDVVEIAHFRKIIERSGERFETRCFSATERSIPHSNTNRVQHLAGNFAAKEAVLKALGTGWARGISFLDIEVQRLPTGKPSIVLRSRCKEVATSLEITDWFLSISHTSSYAMASVIAVSSGLKID